MASKRRQEDTTWKEFINFFITLAITVLCLTLSAAGEPVCYSRISMDERSTTIRMVNCYGTDRICKRFASREEVNIADLSKTLAVQLSLQSSDLSSDLQCDSLEDQSFPPGGSSQDIDFQATTCSKTNLPTVKDGSFDCPSNLDVSEGEACSLICEEGFSPAYSNRIVCEVGIAHEGREWSEGNYKCHAISCRKDDLPVVADGYFNCSGFSVGDKCNLTCHDGYYVTSSDETICEENVDGNGTWRVGNYQCSAISCRKDYLPVVADGYFNCSGFSIGDKCKLTCHDGYYVTSSNETICEENVDGNGTWRVGNYQCSAISCRQDYLPVVADGYFNCSGFSIGDKCNLTCHDGYYATYSNETICEENVDGNGTWRVGNYQCSATTCSTINLPTVRNGSFDCPSNLDVSEGEACSLICEEGFSPAYSNRIVCEVGIAHEGREWSEGNYKCHAISCRKDYLPVVANGYFNCSGFSIGDKCNLTCHDGYYATSSNEPICEENVDGNGTWRVGNYKCFDCNDWIEWNGNAYKYIRTKQNWQKSRRLCENNGGNLVTIENKEEDEFVSKAVMHCNAFPAGTWIGLNDLDRQGKWKWSDGTVAKYKNWGDGQPTGSQHCVVMYARHGNWNDRSCSKDNGALCERSNSSQ